MIEVQPITCSAPTARDLASGVQRLLIRPVLHPLANTAEVRMYSRNACEFILNGFPQERMACPHGSVGDWLWVREPLSMSGQLVSYLADQIQHSSEMKLDSFDKQWRSAIQMPVSLSRTSVQLSSIQVKRIQDLSIVEAIADGMSPENLMHEENGVTEKVLIENHLQRHYDQDFVQKNGWVWLLNVRTLNVNIEEIVKKVNSQDVLGAALSRIH